MKVEQNNKTKMFSDKRNIIIIVLSIIVVILMTTKCNKTNNTSVDVIKPADSTFIEATIDNTPDVDSTIEPNYSIILTKEYIDNIVDTQNIINSFINDISIDSLVSMIGEKRLLSVFDDYFSIKYYSDTIIGDNEYEAIINDSISTNRIINRRFFLKNLREDRVITIDNRNRKLLVGGFVGDKIDIFEFGATAAYMDKKDNVFQYQYGILNETHRISYLKTIRFGKGNKTK